MNWGVFLAVINTIKTKKKSIFYSFGYEFRTGIPHYTATDSQGWSKTTIMIKTVYFSKFRRWFQKILWQPYVELHRQSWNDKMEQISNGSIYWGGGGGEASPTKVLLKTKFTAILNKYLFWRRF